MIQTKLGLIQRGSKVKIKGTEHVATVIAWMEDRDGFKYRLVWFHENAQNDNWLFDFQITSIV